MARHVLDVLDAVVHEEHLPGAVELAHDYFAQQSVVEMRDEGTDRLAVRRRRLDHAQVADPEHRHVQRARNRGRGQGQDLDQLAQPLDALLVGHTEAMLLVDDQQAEARGLDVVLEQA